MNDSFILRDRLWREANERITLSSYAALAEKSKGRAKPEDHDMFRTIMRETAIVSFTQKLLED